MTTKEPDDLVTAAIVNCQRDPSLSLIDELRKVTTKPEGLAFLDDMESRRDELLKRFKDAYLAHGDIRATPETGAAIKSYHHGVVGPLLGVLVNELIGVHCELAIYKSHLKSD